jgi:hypothetical protein
MVFYYVLWVLGVAMGLLAGWFCTRSPLWLAKFIDKEVIGDAADPFRLQRNREFAAYIREHPESWHLRYHRAFLTIRFTGYLAFGIVAMALLMEVLGYFGLAEVAGPGL